MHRLTTPDKIAILMMIFALQTIRAEAAAPEHEPDHLGHPTEVIAISATRLVPAVLVVSHDSAFGWLNYSAQKATIKFEDDILRNLSCRSPGVFGPAANELTSPSVASGAFVTLCSLAPGEYDYHVEFEGRATPLLGTLVVESPS